MTVSSILDQLESIPIKILELRRHSNLYKEYRLYPLQGPPAGCEDLNPQKLSYQYGRNLVEQRCNSIIHEDESQIEFLINSLIALSCKLRMITEESSNKNKEEV
jgi:hypothetical protein